MRARIFETWVGQQASGKTFALRSRIRVLAATRSIGSVFVLDTTGELFDLGPNVGSWADYMELTRHALPRVVVFRDPVSWLAWRELAGELEAQGDIALVVDEAYQWFPSADLDPDARRIVLRGRHLLALDGKQHPAHLLIACQYPRTIHHLAWDQANTILCGVVRCELTDAWLRQNFDPEDVERAQGLGLHEWTVLVGERPRAPGVKWR